MDGRRERGSGGEGMIVSELTGVTATPLIQPKPKLAEHLSLLDEMCWTWESNQGPSVSSSKLRGAVQIKQLPQGRDLRRMSWKSRGLNSTSNGEGHEKRAKGS